MVIDLLEGDNGSSKAPTCQWDLLKSARFAYSISHTVFGLWSPDNVGFSSSIAIPRILIYVFFSLFPFIPDYIAEGHTSLCSQQASYSASYLTLACGHSNFLLPFYPFNASPLPFSNKEMVGIRASLQGRMGPHPLPTKHVQYSGKQASDYPRRSKCHLPVVPP